MSRPNDLENAHAERGKASGQVLVLRYEHREGQPRVVLTLPFGVRTGVGLSELGVAVLDDLNDRRAVHLGAQLVAQPGLLSDLQGNGLIEDLGAEGLEFICELSQEGAANVDAELAEVRRDLERRHLET